jgi:tetratricopeptide (TPR) repeat protein
VQRWLGSAAPEVASALLLASGKDDLEAAMVWRQWTRHRRVERRRGVWRFSSSGWVAVADQIELVLESKIEPESRAIARSVLHAAGLFGVEFSGRSVLGAVSEHSGAGMGSVEATFGELVHVGVFKRMGGSDVYRWFDERAREHALRDETLSGGTLARRLALRLSKSLVEVPSEAREHRINAVRLSRVHRDEEALRRLSETIEGARDSRLHWSYLLTLHRLEEPSTSLALSLSEAALEASHEGYLRMSKALAEAAEASLRARQMDEVKRLGGLANCGRALRRSSETEAEALRLMEEVMNRSYGAGVMLPLDTRAHLLHDLGCLNRSLGRYSAAIDNLKESMRLRKSLVPAETQRYVIAVTEYELGYTLRELNWSGSDPRRMDEAIRCFQSARATLLGGAGGPAEGERRDAAECLHNEALAWHAVGSPESVVRPLLQHAINELRSLRELFHTPTIQERLGVLELDMRNSHLRSDDHAGAAAAADRGRAYARAAYDMDPNPDYLRLVQRLSG